MARLAEFYGDERRRDSEEIAFGIGWRDSGLPGFLFDVFWLAATEELCALRYPVRDLNSRGPFNDWLAPVPLRSELSDYAEHELEVIVLGRVARESLAGLDGWGEMTSDPDGLAWVRARLG